MHASSLADLVCKICADKSFPKHVQRILCKKCTDNNAQFPFFIFLVHCNLPQTYMRKPCVAKRRVATFATLQTSCIFQNAQSLHFSKKGTEHFLHNFCDFFRKLFCKRFFSKKSSTHYMSANVCTTCFAIFWHVLQCLAQNVCNFSKMFCTTGLHFCVFFRKHVLHMVQDVVEVIEGLLVFWLHRA